MGNLRFVKWFLGLSFVFMLLFSSCQGNGASESSKDLIGVETFDTTYFSLSVLQSLMFQEGSEFLRFYNVSEDRNNGDVRLLAVAVRKDSSEIYGPGTKNYILGGDSNNRHKNPITLERERAIEYAQNVHDRDDIPAFSVMVLNEDLFEWCDENNCDRMYLVPETIRLQSRPHYSIRLFSLHSGDGFLFYCPCPTCCPDEEYLLVRPNEQPKAYYGSDEDNDDDEDEDDDESEYR